MAAQNLIRVASGVRLKSSLSPQLVLISALDSVTLAYSSVPCLIVSAGLVKPLFLVYM